MNKEKFDTFNEVRDSGATNMFDIPEVVRLSNYTLSREDCLDIMRNYDKYTEEFK